MGDDGLADSPLLALELAAERGDYEHALAWIERMDAEGLDDPEAIAAVAKIEVELDLDGQAFDRLMRLAGSGDAPDWAYGDLTALAERLARVDEVLHVLAPKPAARVAPERRRAWARLAASAGRTDLLDVWLTEGTIGPADAETLRDLYFLQSDEGDVARAAAAERLNAVRGTSQDASLLRQALARDLNEGEDPAGEVRAAVLKALRDARRQNVSLEERRPLVDALWGAGERASIVDEVMGLGARNLDSWLSAIVESATAAGRRAEAISVIARADGGLGALDGRRRMDRSARAGRARRARTTCCFPSSAGSPTASAKAGCSCYDEHLTRMHQTADRSSSGPRSAARRRRRPPTGRAAAAGCWS